jgi:hypothetical protein
MDFLGVAAVTAVAIADRSAFRVTWPVSHANVGKYVSMSRAIPGTNERIHPGLEKLMPRAELVQFDAFRPGWDGWDAPVPNASSKFWAARVLEGLSVANKKPRHVMACPDGGVTIVLGGEKSVRIECFNSGEIVVAKSAGPGTTTVDEFIGADDAVREVIDIASGFLS